ncbi:hypothetical protein PENSPDRAFT_688946 [Peniophora sp. CONT]|nr:hypothetical protein PENSPDRAFT_688946 [Peniophora sp. CONT]
MGFLTLLPELLDLILDYIDIRTDLLSLARTCRFFAGYVLPDRLDYHTLVVTPYHEALWENLCAHPQLARLVHNLTLYDDPLQVKPHTGKLRLPRGLGSSGHEYTLGRFDAEHIARSLAGMLNARRLHLLYIRKTNVETALHVLPDTLRLVFENLPSLERVSTMTNLGDEDQNALASEHHPLWALSGLRSFEIDVNGGNETIWPAYEAVLRRSPEIENLRLPDFLDDEMMTRLCEIPLPHLKRFNRGYVWSISMTPRIVDFLNAHPTIETLRWATVPSMPIPCSALPALQHLSSPNSSFLAMLLSRERQGSVHLSSMKDVPLNEELLPLLDAIDQDTMRSLHLGTLDNFDTLRALPQYFPNLEELALPRRGAWRENGQIVTRLARAVLRPWIRDLHLFTLEEALQLFPKLEVVKGVRCPVGLEPDWELDDERAKDVLEEMRVAYPILRRVNRWRLR